MNATLTEQAVRDALATVMDPEIPTCPITELGIVDRIAVGDAGIEVDLLPTFAGCPALDVIREDVERALARIAPDASIRVRYVMSTPWTVDRVTPAGFAALKEYGIAPPGSPAVLQIGRPPRARTCPFCGSTDTQPDGDFGPTPCRSIAYCSTCRNPFEVFKDKR